MLIPAWLRCGAAQRMAVPYRLFRPMEVTGGAAIVPGHCAKMQHATSELRAGSSPEWPKSSPAVACASIAPEGGTASACEAQSSATTSWGRMSADACRMAGPGKASRTNASKPATTLLNVPVPLGIPNFLSSRAARPGRLSLTPFAMEWHRHPRCASGNRNASSRPSVVRTTCSRHQPRKHGSPPRSGSPAGQGLCSRNGGAFWPARPGPSAPARCSCPSPFRTATGRCSTVSVLLPTAGRSSPISSQRSFAPVVPHQ